MRALVCVVMACAVMCLMAGTVQAASPLDTLAAGLTYVQPMDDSQGGFAVLSVSVQPLLVEKPDSLTLETAPQYILSQLTLDLLIEGESMTPGISIPLQSVAVSLLASVPIRAGVTHAHGEWCWYVTGDITRKEF